MPDVRKPGVTADIVPTRFAEKTPRTSRVVTGKLRKGRALHDSDVIETCLIMSLSRIIYFPPMRLGDVLGHVHILGSTGFPSASRSHTTTVIGNGRERMREADSHLYWGTMMRLPATIRHHPQPEACLGVASIFLGVSLISYSLRASISSGLLPEGYILFGHMHDSSSQSVFGK